MSGERSSHTQLSRETKEELIVFFPAAIHSAPAGHVPRSLSVPVISRSGPATAEALRRLRSRGSHMDLADGLETGWRRAESFTSDRVYLSGCSTAFNFEELNNAFHLTIKSYIYTVYMYIQYQKLYIYIYTVYMYFCLTHGTTRSWRNADAQCCQLSNIADTFSNFFSLK